MTRVGLFSVVGILSILAAGVEGAVVVELAPAVQEAVNEELGRAPETVVTDEDMASLTKLALTEEPLWGVPDLPHAVNLEELDLSYNAVSMSELDQSKLANLPSLKRLNLSHNNISDLTLLADLDQVEELDLSGNQLTNLNGVQELNSLRVLRVGWNSITDFSAVENHPTLEGLYIGGVAKSGPYNFSPVAPLGLRGPIRQNTPEDLEFLSALPNLKALGLEQLPITDQSPIGGLTKLEELNLDGALHSLGEESILPLGNLTNLQVLDLSNNDLLDIYLTPLTAFRELHLRNNLLTSVDFLNGLENLELVDVRGNRLNLTSSSEARVKLDQLEAEGVQVLADSLGDHLRPRIEMTPYQAFDDQDNNGLRRVVLQVRNREHLFELEVSWSGGSIALGNSDEAQLELPLGETIVTVSGKTLNGETHSSSIRVQVEDYGDSVYIPDLQLRKEIIYLLGLPDDTVLTPDHMLGLTTLDLTDRHVEPTNPPLPSHFAQPPVESIVGLEHAKNLEELHVEGSFQTIVLPIFKSVQYQTHYFDLKGWEALYELEKLRYLRLHGFEELDLGLIAQITSLESLIISSYYSYGTKSDYTSWDALAALPYLNDLTLRYVHSPSWEALAQLQNLDALYLENVRWTEEQDLSPLASLDQLRSFSLTSSHGADISWIHALSNLEELNLYSNDIEDLSPLAGLTKLKVLDVSGNGATSGESLRNLKELEVLDISGNGIRSLDFLRDLPALKELTLGRQFFTEASREYEIVQELRNAGVVVEVTPLPIEDLPFTVDMQPLYVDGNGDGVEQVTLTVHERFKNTLERVVWRWNDQEHEGAQVTTTLPLGETRLEIDYYRTNGSLYRHNVYAKVVDQFSWEALSIDEHGNVDTGRLAGWIIIPDDSGWVWSWSLNRMIFLAEDSVTATGAWFYAPHHEEDPAEFVRDAQQYPNLRWFDTFSLLHWIYVADQSGWVWAQDMNTWLYLPQEELKPGGTWMFSRF